MHTVLENIDNYDETDGWPTRDKHSQLTRLLGLQLEVLAEFDLDSGWNQGSPRKHMLLNVFRPVQWTSLKSKRENR